VLVTIHRHVLAAAALVLVVGGCSLAGGNLLGGREECWAEPPARAASIWRGVLAIDAAGSQLNTPEGEAIPLAPGRLAPRMNAAGVWELAAGDAVEAKNGDDVTIFGGAGSDGYLVMCGIEEIHSAS
jgi:hypothetical protein